MLIEIRKVQFGNKGAELMLYAAWQKMREAYPEADFVMAPSYRGESPYANCAKLGFLQKAWLWRYGIQWGNLAALVPKRVREMYGVVLDKEIDIVLDAAGFAYGDQWSINLCRELAHSIKRWRKQGKKVILLPQAMGPFKSFKIKKYIRIVADNVDLMFPRDPVSYQHVTEAVGELPNIKMAPDFTNLLEGSCPDYFDAENHRFCLVPNYRMIDKTPKKQSEAYLPFMIQCAQYLIKKDQKPFILIHGGADDLKLGQKISEGAGNLPIIRESHPLKIKGILGACYGTIGSRYHGLISALSQGVPSLGTGWSHKYDMLFHDYGFVDGKVDVTASVNEICKKIDLIINPVSRQEIKSVIKTKSRELKKQSEEMWAMVFKVIDSSKKSK